MSEQRERKIILDTETTGKEDDGTPGNHRVIEIGCVEMIGRRLTGRKLQLFMNPERSVDEEAYNIHHISDDFLKDQPKFAEIYQRFYDFIAGTELVIHNAKFDVGFLNHEFKMIGQNIRIENICLVTDTLDIARKKFPGQRISLDALCNKLSIDNSERTSHGALLDSEILAEVYLALTGGQENLNMSGNEGTGLHQDNFDRASILGNDSIKIIEPSPEEIGEHYAYMMGYSNIMIRQKDDSKLPLAHLAFGDEYLLKPLEGAKKVSPEQIQDEIKSKFMSAADYAVYTEAIKVRQEKADRISAKEKKQKEEQMRSVKL